MKRTCIVFALTSLVFALTATAQHPPLDEADLVANGWQKIEENYWQRKTEHGVQSLAYADGTRFMVPQLQAEMDRVRASLETEPTAKKARALEALSGQLAELLTKDDAGGSRKPAPSQCQPWNFLHELSTWINPSGSHGMVASAWGQWNGGGPLCPGSVYASANYALNPVFGTGLLDSDWCHDADSYAGACSVVLWDPQAGPYSSCSVNAVVYLNLFHGLYSLSATESWSTC